MKKFHFALPLLAAALAFLPAAHAQAPAGAPAGSTGVCNDGSYWTGASKMGACRGHKGVKTWFGASTAAPAPAPAAKTTAPASKPASTPAPAMAAKPAPAPAKSTMATPAPAPAPMAPAAAPAKTKAMPAPAANAAPGGGPGMVWVNTPTNVYHCYGDRYYGKTKEGKYMSEKDAIAAGAKGARGATCSK